MSDQTGISWADATWSPWYGCTQVSMGDKGACEGCYARHLSETRMHRVVFGGPGRGIGTRDVRADSAWKEPLRWDRAAAPRQTTIRRPGKGRTPMFVFPSMCDPFDNHPALREPRRRFFDLIRATPNLTWLLLTKRPGNIVKLYADACLDRLGPIEPWPRNAAIGCTVVTQEEADRDIPHLLRAKEALKPAFAFLSMEPLLEGINLRSLPLKGSAHIDALTGSMFQARSNGEPDPGFMSYVSENKIDWIITGGETDQGKHRARPTHPDWFRSIRDQCAAAGVPYHHKQNGEFLPLADLPDGGGITRPTDVMVWPDGWVGGGVHSQRGGLGSMQRHVGKKAAGRLLDGVLHDAMPEVRS